jgi:hypothetical protein
MKFNFTYFLLRVLKYYYYWIFPGVSRIQLKKVKYVVDRGILGKLEVALGQQKSALYYQVNFNLNVKWTDIGQNVSGETFSVIPCPYEGQHR